MTPQGTPTPADIKRWRQYLADERAEAATYRYLARKRGGTRVVIVHEALPGARSREMHGHGWAACLENLDSRVLAPA